MMIDTELLGIEGYPSYILLDPKGEIIKLRTSPEEVETYLRSLQQP